MTVDEFEAIRLTDLEGLYQADAAEKMSISRQTLGRILESARKKIADALVNGKALLIKGGPIKIMPSRVEGIPPTNRPPRRSAGETGRQDVRDIHRPHGFGPGPVDPR